MPEFLSAAWFDLLAESLPEVAGDVDLCIEYAVGDLRYQLEAHGGKVEVLPEGGRTPDLTISLSREAAADLAAGRTSPRDAIRAGRIRVRGDLASLTAAAGILGPLTGALAGVRAATVYP